MVAGNHVRLVFFDKKIVTVKYIRVWIRGKSSNEKGKVIDNELLIIQGFFDEIFSNYDLPDLKERLWQLIQKKLN